MSDPVMQNASSSDPSPVALSPVQRNHSSVWGFAVSILIALALAALIRVFIFAPYLVSGTSMLPNFQNYNYVLVDRLTYDFSQPQRGDVVVLKLPEETDRDLIKRVIGVPGDTVVLTGANPTITIINAQHPQGVALDEPYVSSANYGGTTNTRYTLGPNQYFVMGDNRAVSADSRIWGLLPRSDIIGVVMLRLYPFNEIGFFPAQTRYQNI